MNATPQQIIEHIERYSRAAGAAFARPELQDVIKWHDKCPSERHPCLADLYGQRPGATGSGQR